MGASDFPSLKALADVAADMLSRAGFNVDYQVMDWGSVVQRRAKKDPIAQGGWSAFCTFWAGLDQANPAVSAFLRGTGQSAAIGWPTSAAIERLRDQWLDAPDTAARKALADDLQRRPSPTCPTCRSGSTSTRPLQAVPDGRPRRRAGVLERQEGLRRRGRPGSGTARGLRDGLPDPSPACRPTPGSGSVSGRQVGGSRPLTRPPSPLCGEARGAEADLDTPGSRARTISADACLGLAHARASDQALQAVSRAISTETAAI